MAAEIERHHLTLRSKDESRLVLAEVELGVALTLRERLFRHFRSTLCSNDRPEDAGAKTPAA